MRFLVPLAFSTALLLSACTTAKVVSQSGEAAQPPFVGSVWIAEDIAGAPVVSGTDVTLLMDRTSRAGGKAGCNTYGSAYQLNGDTLAFSQDFSTKMFCSPDAVMAQEQTYLALLAQVTGYQMQGEKLALTTADGKSILFHKK